MRYSVNKSGTIRDVARKYNLRIFVETGTYHGDMVDAMRGYFDRIYSIELDERLYKEAVKRFSGSHSVNLILGDSGVELEKVLKEIKEPALIWLDAHYSGNGTARGKKDTPISEELTCIMTCGINHVVLIDDANCFGSDPAYPTVPDIKWRVGWCYDVEVKDNIIRITP